MHSLVFRDLAMKYKILAYPLWIVVFVISCTSSSTVETPFHLPPGTINVSFALAADMREYTGFNRHYFRGVCERLATGGTGDFMISPGDIDPPEQVLNTLHTYVSEDYIWYPVIGNHEAETLNDMSWLRTFNENGTKLPAIVNSGPLGGKETTYSFEYGNTHFIIINEYFDNNIDTQTDGDIPDQLYNWLITDLASNTKPIVFVFGHEPAFPKQDEESGRLRHETDSLNKYTAHRDRFWNLLKINGVTAYFCGHTHNYSKAKINGIWQIDVGHARGTADTGSRSTFLLIYSMDDNTVWVSTYRLNLESNKYELTAMEQL